MEITILGVREMAKKETELEKAQEKAEELVRGTNKKIEKIGEVSEPLSDNLNKIQSLFDNIRGLSNESKLTLDKLKKERLNWIQQVETIIEDYKKAELKTMGAGVAGAGAGIAVAALGPTAAMGLATTVGVASTGTAISTLSGAAATNAALAWLGGGALTAGGGGMAAGNTLIFLTGPVGWTIAGATLLGSGALFLKGKNDKEKLEKVYTAISKRDIDLYRLSIVEMNERITKITNETDLLQNAIQEIGNYGDDYDEMTEKQQYNLMSFVNLMESSTALLTHPILGLQPKFTQRDLDGFLVESKLIVEEKEKQELYIVLANLLYKIVLDDTDKKLLWKSLRGNKDFMESLSLAKKDFELTDMNNIELALNYKY